MIYSLLSRNASSRSILFSSQYSYTFFHVEYAGLLSCCIFYGPTICTICLLFPFCLSTSIFGHSYLQYPTLQYLKHFTSSTLFYYLTSTSFFIPHYITLVANILYLFWGFSLFSFSFFFFVLQLWARYLNFLQFQHSFSLFPSNYALSKAKACFSLSMLLRRLLYCCWDIVLMPQDQSERFLILLKLYLLGCKIFTQLDTYCLTNYCPSTRVILSPLRRGSLL